MRIMLPAPIPQMNGLHQNTFGSLYFLFSRILFVTDVIILCIQSGIKANPYRKCFSRPIEGLLSEYTYIDSSTALRARLIELLQRRIGFLPVDEYIAQHPETQRAMFSANSGNIVKATDKRVSVDGHDTMEILVRHLGSSISIQGLRKVVERELSKKSSGDV